MTSICEVQKSSMTDKLVLKINNVKYWIRKRAINFAMSIIRRSVGECNYKKYAEREFEAAGWTDKDGHFNCDMQKLICKNVLDLLAVFSTHGHSGTTAPYATNLFEKLSSFSPLLPLTGKDSEWNEIGENKWQNKRCSHIFKNEDGKAYDSNGKVFREPDGCCYTSRNSHVFIEFPYMPKTEYVDVSKKD